MASEESLHQIVKTNASHKNSLIEDRHTWLQTEHDLHNAGIRLPLFHRWPWAECNRKSTYRLVVVRNDSNAVLGAAGVRIDSSRVLPGHKFLRVIQFGHALPETAWDPLIAALKSQAHNDPRVLRLSIGVFSRNRRDEIASLLKKYGFKKLRQPHSYRYTLTLDLHPSEEEVLTRLHKTARKNLREAEKAQLFVTPLTQAIYADRIASLQREAMSRTGGNAEALDTDAALELSRLYPHLSCVVGLFPSAADLDPSNLLGFAWGCMHGDHAEYRAAGTMRLPDRNIAISYPLLWELIAWAKREGAVWFDLGGVTLDDSASDPLSGISNFKRYFSRNVEEVGEEWILEPHPERVRLATLLGHLARGITGLPRKFKGRR
jgi:FemAB family